MSESEIAQLLREIGSVHENTQRIEKKIDHIEARIEVFSQVTARHSERLKALEAGLELAQARISEMKKETTSSLKRLLWFVVGGCVSLIGLIWKMKGN